MVVPSQSLETAWVVRPPRKSLYLGCWLDRRQFALAHCTEHQRSRTPTRLAHSAIQRQLQDSVRTPCGFRAGTCQAVAGPSIGAKDGDVH